MPAPTIPSYVQQRAKSFSATLELPTEILYHHTAFRRSFKSDFYSCYRRKSEIIAPRFVGLAIPQAKAKKKAADAPTTNHHGLAHTAKASGSGKYAEDATPPTATTAPDNAEPR